MRAERAEARVKAIEAELIQTTKSSARKVSELQARLAEAGIY